MPIYALGELRPSIDPTAFVHPDAVVIGNVHLGANVSVWPGVVLRGDFGRIDIGEQTSVQDNAMIHADQHGTWVGAHCMIGHLAHLEGCRVGPRALVGTAAAVLNGAVVSENALVAAGAVVPPGFVVPPDTTAVGVPAVIRERASFPDLTHATSEYSQMAERYKRELVRLDQH